MPRSWRRFAERVQLMRMAKGLLSFAVLLTWNCNGCLGSSSFSLIGDCHVINVLFLLNHVLSLVPWPVTMRFCVGPSSFFPFLEILGSQPEILEFTDLASFLMLVVPFLLSMRHLCLSCNGSVLQSSQAQFHWPCQHMGPRSRFSQSGPMDCPSFHSFSRASSPRPSHRIWMSWMVNRWTRFFIGSFANRARTQILLLTICILHLAPLTSSHLWLYFPSPCFTARKQ